MSVLETCHRLISKLTQISYCYLSKLYKSKGVVYMLHNISDADSEFSISERDLEYFLSKLDCSKVINLSEWEKKSGFVAITIDDVPENFYLKGFTIFKKYGIPFTIFVSTSLLNKPGYISDVQLKEMSQCELCTVGSHGTKHEFYKNFTHDEKIRFLEDSQKELSEICKCRVEMFAFPYGSFYACGFKDKKLVSRYYKYGFGTIGTVIASINILPKYFLPRVNLTSGLIHSNYE